MTPAVLTFAFPLPPNLNREQTQHWGAKHRMRQEWYQSADNCQVYGRVPAPPPKAWTRVRIAAVLTMPTVMDEDNAMRRAAKWPLDWLKTRGYIVNDTRKVVEWAGLPEQRITRSTPPGLTITITPLEEG